MTSESSKFLPDTSCMVAAVCGWHEHHERAAGEINRRLDSGEAMVIAGPALVESYAVLTRLPPPYRLSAGDALRVLELSFMNVSTELAVLSEEGYRDLLLEGPRRDITGGRMYDAVILACCVAAQVDVLLTFNERDFGRLAPERLALVVPR